MTAPSLSYSLHDRLIGWLNGDAFGAPPGGLKLALMTALPNPDGSDVVELEPSQDDAYFRQDFEFGSTTRDTGVSSVKNTAPFVFGPATGNWPSVGFAGVMTDDGELLLYSPLPATRACKAGDSISFGIDALQLRFR